MRQLELLLTMVIIPFVGKMLGRKCAYWGIFCPPIPAIVLKMNHPLTFLMLCSR
jgi:hypothetical protein